MNKLAIACAILFFRSVIAMDIRIVIFNDSEQEICVFKGEGDWLGRFGPGMAIGLKHTDHKLENSCYFSPLYIKFLESDLSESDLDGLYFESKITLKNSFFRAYASLFIGKKGRFTLLDKAKALSSVEKNPFYFDVHIKQVPNQSTLTIDIFDAK